jgi:hypothetical protein
MNGLKSIIIINNNMKGTPPKPCRIGGHPAPAGRALPNLINAVRMFKIKTAFVLTLILTLTF